MSENVYSSFVNTVCNVLIGNIKTQSVGNDCLQMWTTSNQELNDSWVSNPVAELANPDQPWNPVSNPYVPEGYTYPDDGTVITTTGSDGQPISYWQCNYDPTKTGPDTADENQVEMTNGLNAAQNPDEMENFEKTYCTQDYIDDWSESFATTVTIQQSNIYNPNDSHNNPTWSTTQSENLSEMNSWSSMISSTAQEETTPGKNQASQQNSMMQTLSNYQQVIAQMGDAVVGVIKSTVSAMQKTL